MTPPTKPNPHLPDGWWDDIDATSRSFAGRLATKSNDYDDLYQVGLLTGWQAASEEWKPERGAWGQYMFTRIKQEMLRYNYRNAHVLQAPEYITKSALKVRQMMSTLASADIPAGDIRDMVIHRTWLTDERVNDEVRRSLKRLESRCAIQYAKYKEPLSPSLLRRLVEAAEMEAVDIADCTHLEANANSDELDLRSAYSVVIGELREPLRTVLLLRADGYKHREIASELVERGLKARELTRQAVLAIERQAVTEAKRALSRHGVSADDLPL